MTDRNREKKQTPARGREKAQGAGRIGLPEILCVLFVLFSGCYLVLRVLDAVHQTGDPLPLRLYGLLFPAALALSVLAAAFFRRCPERRLPGLFLASGLSLGILFLFVMPGLSAPDEVSHYITAYRLSSRMLGQPDLTEDLGLAAVRQEDYHLEDLSGTRTLDIPDDEEPPAEMLGNPLRYATYRAVADWDQRYSLDTRSVSSGFPDVRSTPVMYLPQAAGISLARLLSLRAPSLVFLGGFMNLLVFLLLTAAAIHLAPFGKELYFGAGLLPMTLHLASSMSYDAGILGTVFLFTAEVLRLSYGEQVKVTWRDLLLLSLLIAAFGPCKLVYSVLVFLALLIPAERFGRLKKAPAFLLLFLVLTLSMAAVNAGVIRGYAAAGSQAAGAEAVTAAEAEAAGAVEAAGDAAAAGGAEAAAEAEETETGTGTAAEVTRGYPVSELLHRPVFIVRMVLDTVSFQSDELVLGMTGMWLGNLDPLIGLPFFAVLFYLTGLLVLMLRRPGERCPMGAGARLWCGLLILGVFLLTAGAMLVSWTTRGAPVIEGIQGRYFLPVLPLLLMLFENGLVVSSKDLRRAVLLGFFCMDCFALLRIFSLACLRV